jgi:hypothetical protein
MEIACLLGEIGFEAFFLYLRHIFSGQLPLRSEGKNQISDILPAGPYQR